MNNNPVERKVFVSYSRADTEIVFPLVERLERESGIRFWIDREGIESAAQFEEVIIRAIDQAEVVLFMLSDNSQHSQWTKDEISYAKNTGKRVVPIVLDGGELKGWFLFKFGRINYIDASQNDQLQRLSLDIRKWLPVAPLNKPIHDPGSTYIIDEEIPESTHDHSGVSNSIERNRREVNPTQTQTPAHDTATSSISITSDAATSSQAQRGSKFIPSFFRQHRKGCSITLVVAFVCCALIIVVEPLTFQSPPDESQIDVKNNKVAEPCPNCGGSGTVHSDGEMLVCPACTGTGVITDKTPMGIVDGHIYVDLGLSVRWANCNVGTDAPHKSGNYYAWGETSPKTDYSADNSVTFRMKDEMDIAGDSIYDVARACWGNDWRLPTEVEAQELIDMCTWEWTEVCGNEGCRITGPSGLSIFLPACGAYEEDSLSSVGEDGCYWTSTAVIWGCAFGLSIEKEPFRYQLPSCIRYYGYTIRPVLE